MERISLAPMMKFSDAHFRRLFRIIHPSVVLYTEMIVDKTVIHICDQKLDSFLGSSDGHTVVQLASNNPSEFVQASKKIIERGFKEINLNTGCPSDRVQCGCFGAVLMKTPNLVADIIRAAKTAFPEGIFSVKCRIGIDTEDSYEFFKSYIDTVSAANPGMHFIVHARKAWLKGLSTRENRNVPPLHYNYVYRISRERPDLKFTINGGIATIEGVKSHLTQFNGDVMIGRAVYENPLFLYQLLQELSDKPLIIHNNVDEYRRYLMKLYVTYADDVLEKEKHLPSRKLIHPLLEMFHGHSFANTYRSLVHKHFISTTPELNTVKLKFSEKIDVVLSTIHQMKQTIFSDRSSRPLTLLEPLST